MKDFEKRFVTNDGTERVTIFREEYSENPRNMTDEPLHCADFSRDYSIMQKDEREFTSAREAIISFLCNYGKQNAIIDFLVNNGHHLEDSKCSGNNALVYYRSAKMWVLHEYCKFYGENRYFWREVCDLEARKSDIDFYELLENLTDSTIDIFCSPEFWGDGIKINSYSFGYYGGLSFSDYFDSKSDGLCWLEKEEFLKYSGNNEDYWKKSLHDIEFLIDELVAWADNDVFRFETEKKVEYNIVKTYKSEEREPESYDQTDWEFMDSCGGFYGDLDKITDWILGEAGYKKEDLVEQF